MESETPPNETHSLGVAPHRGEKHPRLGPGRHQGDTVSVLPHPRQPLGGMGAEGGIQPYLAKPRLGQAVVRRRIAMPRRRPWHILRRAGIEIELPQRRDDAGRGQPFDVAGRTIGLIRHIVYTPRTGFPLSQGRIRNAKQASASGPVSPILPLVALLLSAPIIIYAWIYSINIHFFFDEINTCAYNMQTFQYPGQLRSE